MKAEQKIDIILEQQKKVSESSIHGLRKLKKDFPVANIYFHMDLDGVTSAIAMREYLKEAGIKTISATPIQYGDEEYAVKKSREGVLNVLVDFAHGKTWMNVHLDHHDSQIGVSEGAKVHFSESPSNVKTIQYTISNKDIFPASDIDIISKVDSADFARHGITPDDVIRASFATDESLSAEKNREMMSLACNKLLLSYKNKPDFMSRVVMESKPSLHNMYLNVVKLAKENGYHLPEKVDQLSDNFFVHRQDNMKGEQIAPLHIDGLAKNGGSALIENSATVVQKGGGICWGNNQYDRYTIFKAYPDCHYLMTIWETLGMIQVSKNPFIPLRNPYHLGEIAQKTLNLFKAELQSERVNLNVMKQVYEKLIKKKSIKGAVGFTWPDFEALFEGQIKGIQSSNEWWPNMVKDIANKPSQWLSPKQQAILEKVTVSAWDVIQASSGGHKDITNISGINFLRDGREFLYYRLAPAMATELQNKYLI